MQGLVSLTNVEYRGTKFTGKEKYNVSNVAIEEAYMIFNMGIDENSPFVVQFIRASRPVMNQGFNEILLLAHACHFIFKLYRYKTPFFLLV